MADTLTWNNQQVSEHTRMRMERPCNVSRFGKSIADPRKTTTPQPPKIWKLAVKLTSIAPDVAFSSMGLFLTIPEAAP
jgi:hypothetical protein